MTTNTPPSPPLTPLHELINKPLDVDLTIEEAADRLPRGDSRCIQCEGEGEE